MSFRRSIENIYSVVKLLVLAAPVALSILTVVYHESLLKSVSQYIKPAVVEMFREEVGSAVEEALMNDTFVIKLDEAQLIEVKGWIADGDQESAAGIMVIANRVLDIKFHNFATRTYNIYDWHTGDFIKKQKGVLTDEGWIMLESDQQ